MNLSKKEYLILELLSARGAHAETHGYELASTSNGLLKATTIYSAMYSLEQKGFLASRLEKYVPGNRGRARRFYKMTPAGIKAYKALMTLNTL